jgi:hypothetical protein
VVDIEVHHATALRFDDGAPVRAASAIAPFGGGWLIAQDDGTHAAWWADEQVTRVRLFPPVAGHDLFSEEAGTKRLKPDLEAACAVDVGGAPGTLLLGSGSLPARTRVALVTTTERDAPQVVAADLTELYRRVAEALEIPVERRNLEGACVVDDHLRWFQRGDRRAGVPDASIDVRLDDLLAAVVGDVHAADVRFGEVRRYDLAAAGLQEVGDVPLGVTDAVALTDGRVLVSAAAEDTDDPVADGPVSASALVVLDGERVSAGVEVPASPDGTVHKVEGLATVTETAGAVELLAVVDADDPTLASPLLRLTVTGLG